MKTVRFRIFLLLAASSVAFIIGLCQMQSSEQRRLRLLSYQAAQEARNYVTKIVNLKSTSMTNMVDDYTVWDDMAAFVHTRDHVWAVQNLDQALSTYATDATWVFDLNMRQVYGSDPQLSAMNKCPVSSDALQKAFTGHEQIHFFANSPGGLVEIVGDPIHKTADRQRTGPRFGYFLTGRLWNRSTLSTLSDLTGAQAYLSHPSASGGTINCQVLDDGSVLYTRQLLDANGIPVKAMCVSIDSRIVRLLRQSNSTTVSLVLWFTMLSLGLLFFYLFIWVSLPLKRIVTTLRTKDLEEMHGLEDSSSEFGEMARLVHDFFSQQQTLLEEIAERARAEAELAASRDELEMRVERRTRQLKEAYDSTIEGWSRALDLRDQETEGHCRRVTDMTLRLARALGMDERQLVDVARGALLHDIGKVGIPDSILLKPGPLTDEEWKIMRMHPIYAYELLKPIEFLKPALNIPYCHHEKWDGTGYPRGLKGDEIPLEARLFAIVDVWDALRSDRPYRKGWPEMKIMEHIRSLAGTHFEPFAAEMFVSIVTGEYDDVCPLIHRQAA